MLHLLQYQFTMFRAKQTACVLIRRISLPYGDLAIQQALTNPSIPEILLFDMLESLTEPVHTNDPRSSVSVY